MIVYNAGRAWFTDKADAENYRKAYGMKPAVTVKIKVTSREELVELLNALCSPIPRKTGAPPTPLNKVADAAFVAGHVDIGSIARGLKDR